MVIATVFLTIIAMAGGYILAEQQRGTERASGGGALPSTEQTTSSRPPFTPPGPFCLQAARDMAKQENFHNDLWQVLKVHVDRTNSTIWICTDVQGRLFYQGWTNVDQDLEQGKNGLFLPEVEEVGKDSYKVTAANGNVIEVSSSRLTVTFASGKETQRDKARVIK
ncbi:hypothetical protein [Paractinoplanes lichenicola]|uniref:Uncharacterized protein n=1 Tax=Paractinoplanes lichenicola TaxID=2802976 RepID=A0ABS1W0U3_9ACTN|nr:hypothetical protein [Actinoplanes lichenicola]MBL7260357.1 hypothetical protein [Actinoplanes lichenicola]